MFTPVTGFTPCAAPWMYQPPGQPSPWMASRRLFHAFGGEMTGCGAGSVVGSCSTTLWKIPRLMVAVSRRTTKGTVFPSSVVVIATSAGTTSCSAAP